MRNKKINRFIQICLDIADVVDEQGKECNNFCIDNLGCGYKVISGYLRRGVQEVIELQSSYHHIKEMKEFAEYSEKEARAVLLDIFGDEELDSLNDDDYTKIKAFCAELRKKWEDDDEEENR